MKKENEIHGVVKPSSQKGWSLGHEMEISPRISLNRKMRLLGFYARTIN
jgi:hypothetical protein